jgi:hypothetical protein
MIYIPIDSSLKSASIDNSYMVLEKKCKVISKFSEMKKLTFRVINSEYTSHGSVTQMIKNSI